MKPLRFRISMGMVVGVALLVSGCSVSDETAVLTADDSAAETTQVGESKPSEGDEPKSNDRYRPSDEQVRTLSADCAEDEDMACDILFAMTTEGSVTEGVVRDCGSSGPEPASSDRYFFCTADIELSGQDYWFDESSPALPGIVSACENADMTACDFLYFRSPPGSEYERIGNTCAGRVAVAVPDCRTMMRAATSGEG